MHVSITIPLKLSEIKLDEACEQYQLKSTSDLDEDRTRKFL